MSTYTDAMAEIERIWDTQVPPRFSTSLTIKDRTYLRLAALEFEAQRARRGRQRYVLPSAQLPAYCSCCGCITRYCICRCCCGR